MPLQSSPHTQDRMPVSRLMQWVLLATLPGALALFVFFGWGVLINLLLCAGFALAFEALILWLRDRPIKATLLDYSALVTAVLLGLSLPPLLPWWMTILGIGFAIVFAKHLFGGLGFNPFNPAMVGYVLLLISFPAQMTAWLPPQSLAANPASLWETLHFIFTGSGPAGETIEQIRAGLDGFTMATPLDHFKTNQGLGFRTEEILDSPVYGGLAGVGWQWVNLGFLAGGLLLAFKKIISWRISLAMLIGITVMAALLWGVDTDAFASPLLHLLSGATMLGAFFIATDPITAATTRKGRWIFGLGIGALTILIRTFGGYPDAVAFAVLLFNMAVPTIDYYTRPRVYGHQKSGHKKAGHKKFGEKS